MLKNYVLSFLAMTFYPFLLVPSLLAFALVILMLGKFSLPVKPIAGCLVLVIGTMLVYYNVMKVHLRHQCSQIKDAKEYDDAVMLGFNFLCEERMIAYDKRKIKEYYYRDLEKIASGKDKKGGLAVELTFGQDKVILPVGSKGQAERTAAFLVRKNSNVSLENISAEGNGHLHSIDHTEKQA